MTGSGGAADANISHASEGGARRRGQGPGGRTRRSVFLRPHFPQPASFARRTPSVWLQGLGRGWFLLRRKRVVNRPTVTVTGIVDADPNALPGPRHDRGGGAVCPCASPATPSCSPAAAFAPCPARLRAAPPPVTRPHHPAPAWRDSRPSGTEPAARDGPSGRSCPPPRKGVNKEQETARRDAAVLGPGGKAGRCRSPHSLAPRCSSGLTGMMPEPGRGGGTRPGGRRRPRGHAASRWETSVLPGGLCRRPCGRGGVRGVSAGLSDEEGFEPRPEDREDPACRGRRRDIPAKGPEHDAARPVARRLRPPSQRRRTGGSHPKLRQRGPASPPGG